MAFHVEFSVFGCLWRKQLHQDVETTCEQGQRKRRKWRDLHRRVFVLQIPFVESVPRQGDDGNEEEDPRREHPVKFRLGFILQNRPFFYDGSKGDEQTGHADTRDEDIGHGEVLKVVHAQPKALIF